jgi:hypothetical protein
MSDFNTSKVDGNAVGSAEWNQLSDVDNLTTTSGQTPSTTDLFQLSIASARYSSGGQFFTDSGTANAYVLSPVSPFKSPVDATNTYFNGMTIRFRAGNANSGASTINVNGAGSKNLKKEDGSTDLTAGDILTTKDSRFRYNGTSFVLVQDIRSATTTNQGVVFLSNPITIANNATDANNDIDFSAGTVQFSDGSGQALYAGGTGQLDVLFGTGNGMLATGTKAINSTYHLFMVSNPTTGVSKPLAILGIAGTAPDPTSVLPSGFTKFKRVGSILTDASGNILLFKQDKDEFIFTTNISAFNATSPVLNTDLTLRTPLGLEVGAFLTGTVSHSGTGYLIYWLKSKIKGDSIVGAVMSDISASRGLIAPTYPIKTNTSAQIQHGRDAAGGSGNVIMLLIGWKDYTLNY